MNEWGYVDPVQRVHEQQALRRMAHPNWGPQPQAWQGTAQPVQQYYPVQSPLAGLDFAQQQVVLPNLPRRQNLLADAVLGAVLGGLVGYLASRRSRRQERQDQRLSELKASLGIGEEL